MIIITNFKVWKYIIILVRTYDIITSRMEFRHARHACTVWYNMWWYRTTNASSNQEVFTRGMGTWGRETKKSKTLTWYWVAVPLIQRDQHAKPGLSGGALRATLSESSSLPSCVPRRRRSNSTPFFYPRTEGLNTRCCRRHPYRHHHHHRHRVAASAALYTSIRISDRARSHTHPLTIIPSTFSYYNTTLSRASVFVGDDASIKF